MKALPLLALLSLTAACDVEDWGPAYLAKGQRSVQDNDLERGREGYATYCIGCHGPNGDGKGPAARFFDPKPRDFHAGRLKYTAGPSGSTPADDDYVRTLRHGLAGTAMPSFALVPEKELRAIVAYVRTFYPAGKNESVAPPVPIPEDPWRDKPAAEAIAEGARVYHGLASCTSCHAGYEPKDKALAAMASFNMDTSEGLRDHFYDAIPKDSDWGGPLTPPDFLFQRTKAANSRAELARVIATGVGGTAMPSWGAALTPQQLWGLAYYVESLVAIRDTPEAYRLHRQLLAQSSSH